MNRRRMELPEDPDARATFADPPCVTAPLTRLDLAAEGISAVIWATGYGVDFGWIDLPVTDAKGEAVHRNGISDGAGPVFPRPAMAVEDELLVPVRRRRRRRRARRSYFGAARLTSPLAQRAYRDRRRSGIRSPQKIAQTCEPRSQSPLTVNPCHAPACSSPHRTIRGTRHDLWRL